MASTLCAFLAMLATLAVLFSADASGTSGAVGCLSCHRYPGLVQRGQDGHLHVVHVDERLYARSPHGELGCRECHSTISRVPHVGETAVECTTRCHLHDKSRIAAYPLKGFHREEQSYIARLEDGSSCRVCHPMYPHSEDPVVRTFLNMHTGYVRCEVCHVDRVKYPNLRYDWERGRRAEFGGDAFGTFYDPRERAPDASVHLISRLAVLVNGAAAVEPMTNVSDAARAKRFVEEESSLVVERRREELGYFHRDVVRKEVSVACDECHSADSILDYRALGFDARKTDALMHLNMPGVLTKYDTFYLPKLF